MDNWNRNDLNTYTGITAQRRNRRRPAGQAEGNALQDAGEADYSAYRRPETPEREIPAPAEAPAEPEERTAPAEIHEPEDFAEAVTAAEPEATAEPEERTAPAEPAGNDGPKEPGEPEEPEETETSAEPAEPEIVKQEADSRVPQEARRMAAAPYGEGGAAHRPATTMPPAARPAAARPAAARPASRQPAPGGNRVVVHPRRPLPEEEPLTGTRRPAEPRPERRLQQRVSVGYAPGRMSDGMTQQLPGRDAMRDSMYTQNAKDYLDRRKHPFRAEEDSRQTPERPGSKALHALIAIIVLAGLVLSGWMFMKNRGNNEQTITREPPQVISFEAHETGGQTAPADLTFSVVTEKAVEAIRMRAEGDVELQTEASCGDNADSKDWLMKIHFDTGFQGTVRLQARRTGEENWYDTDYTSEVDVSSPLIPESQTTEAPALSGKTADNPPEDAEDGPEGESGEEPEGESGEEPEDESGEEPEDEPENEPRAAENEGFEAEEEELPAGELKTAAPTFTPAPATPEPTAIPPLTAEAAPEANPDLITATTVWSSLTKKEKAYTRLAKELIHMPEADEYTNKQLGVMTFRGDNFRRNAAAGTLSAAPLALTVRWQAESGSSRGANQTYYGYGWTGQAVIARWSTEVRAHSNITESKIEQKALKEVIIAGLDGNIRFLDLNDGKITRNSIKLGYPMRGTPSLHTRGYPFLSVGQAARKMKTKTGKIGVRQYNLFTQNELKMLDGLDGKYHRPLNDVGSFETSALVDRTSDTLITVGTNGMLYLEALNTTFDYNTGIMTVAPSVTAMTSRAKGQKSNALLAVESSPAAYDKYVFYADMGGVLRCVDTNTLSPVWAVNTGDSVMAAIAMDMTPDRQLNLYTANMLNNRKKGNSSIQIRRYDAMSGKEKWTAEIGVYKGKKDKTDVGAKASPVIGQNSLSDLVYFTVTGLSADGRTALGLEGEPAAALIALDKETGKTVWAFGLESRSESSPIALYDQEGNGWILQCEQNGTIHLLEGLNGKEISSLSLEAEIEASPAAYNNVVVIGTTGKGTSFVYGIEVKLDRPEEEPEQPENGQAEQPEAQEAEGGEKEDEEPAEEPEDPDEPGEEEGGSDDDEIYGGA